MLPEGKIEIWSIHRDSETEPRSYLDVLSEEERSRAGKFRFDKDRDMFVLGKGILRRLLGYYTKSHPSEIKFEYGEHGKPFLPYSNSPHFNISHSGKVLVMAFCLRYPLGVDVEKIKYDFDIMEVAKHHFSLREMQALKNLNAKDRVKGFYRCWTRKESFIKAKGSGLSFPLDAFAVGLDDDHKAAVLETNWDENEKFEWQLSSFIPKEGYLAAVSVQAENMAIEHFDWTSFKH